MFKGFVKGYWESQKYDLVTAVVVVPISFAVLGWFKVVPWTWLLVAAPPVLVLGIVVIAIRRHRGQPQKAVEPITARSSDFEFARTGPLPPVPDKTPETLLTVQELERQMRQT